MKRWVWLGLLGLVACKETPVVGPQVCPGTEEDPAAQTASLPTESLGESAAMATAQAPLQASREEAVLVRFKAREAVSPLAAVASYASSVESMGGKVTARFGSLRTVAARVTPEQRRALEANPDVEFVEADRPVRAFGLPALPPAALLAQTGSAGEIPEGVKLVQAPAVWDANNDASLDPGAPAGQGIKVCVIDSGIDPRHPDLKAVYIGGRDFVEDDDDPSDFDKKAERWGGGHGTHVAGTIAAQFGSGGSVLPGADPNGVVGVAPGVQLLIARVLDTQGNGSTSDVISALSWCAAQGAKIASLSLGSQDKAPSEELAFQQAWDQGMLSVAATGNSGTADPNTSPPVAYPAAYPTVVAVGAVTMDGSHPTFSQYGAQVSLVAPGVNVLSTMRMGASSYARVRADGADFTAQSLEHSGHGDYSGPIVNCGLADTATSCGENQCDGFVAYVERGTITFGDKVRNVRKQGAKAVIIGNNVPDDDGAYTLGAPGNWPPTAIVSFDSGGLIRGLGGKDGSVSLIGVDYAREVGTSMATPHVSGVAALVWSARPTLTNAEVRDLLEKSAKDLGPTGRDEKYGFGLVQAKDALNRLNTLP